MTMRGTGRSHGAATIVNAIANGRGAAFGLDLCTKATVDLREGEGVDVTMDGLVDESTELVERCVKAVLDRFEAHYHAKVTTSSNIPVSKGLKSSSAAANAVILATLDALGEDLPVLDAVRLGTRAAVEAGVSVTGAFDDACACALGGLVLTDNRSEEVLHRRPMPDYIRALVHVPDFQVRKRSLPRERIAGFKGLVDLAFQEAWEGDLYRAMTLNGLCYSAALGLDQEVAVKALANGAMAAGLSGTGPATVILVVEDKVAELVRSMKEHPLIEVPIFNAEVDG